MQSMERVLRAVIAFIGICSSVSVLLDLVGPVFHFPLIDYADHRDQDCPRRQPPILKGIRLHHIG